MYAGCKVRREGAHWLNYISDRAKYKTNLPPEAFRTTTQPGLRLDNINTDIKGPKIPAGKRPETWETVRHYTVLAAAQIDKFVGSEAQQVKTGHVFKYSKPYKFLAVLFLYNKKLLYRNKTAEN